MLTCGSLEFVDSLVDGLGYIVQVTRGHLAQRITVLIISHRIGQDFRYSLHGSSSRLGYNFKSQSGDLTQKYILRPEMFSVIVLQACRWNADLIQTDKCHD